MKQLTGKLIIRSTGYTAAGWIDPRLRLQGGTIAKTPGHLKYQAPTDQFQTTTPQLMPADGIGSHHHTVEGRIY